MVNLTKRQFEILGLIQKTKTSNNKDIVSFFNKKNEKISRITIGRELGILLEKDLIEKIGKGRNIKYQEKIANKLLAYFNINNYFKKNADEREIQFERFNINVFQNLLGIFSEGEISLLRELNNKYQKRIAKISPFIFQKELERLTVEFSWKSSRLEGNTYTLIDTEVLIKDQKEAKGHKKEEAVMILNHKKSLDYVLKDKKYFQKLNIRKIEDIHRLLVSGLNVGFGMRKGSVGIIGTRYKPLDNQQQIKEVLEKMVRAVNKEENPFAKALIAVLLIAYIQPFEDGNKRTARLIGNAILFSHGICPLSYRNINEGEYKKATILFYEQNSARYFKELFIEQYRFAVNNYFG